MVVGKSIAHTRSAEADGPLCGCPWPQPLAREPAAVGGSFPVPPGAAPPPPNHRSEIVTVPTSPPRGLNTSVYVPLPGSVTASVVPAWKT